MFTTNYVVSYHFVAICLYMYFSKDLRNFTWESIITEMKERVPDVLATIAVPKVKDGQQQIAPLCTTYDTLMYTRLKELSLAIVQKLNSIVLNVGYTTETCINNINKQIKIEQDSVYFSYSAIFLVTYNCFDSFSFYNFDPGMF